MKCANRIIFIGLLVLLSMIEALATHYHQQATDALVCLLNQQAMIRLSEVPLDYAHFSKTLQTLVEDGADPNVSVSYISCGRREMSAAQEGAGAVHFVAETSDADLISFLVSHKATVNAQTAYGITPLMLAAKSGQHAMVDRLISLGAKHDISSYIGMSALEYATDAGDGSVLQLLGYGAQPSLFRKNARIKELLSLSQEINQPNSHGVTPLAIALINRDRKAMSSLLSHGALFNIGRINCLRLARNIAERPKDKECRTFYERLADFARYHFVMETALCSPETPTEVLWIIGELAVRFSG